MKVAPKKDIACFLEEKMLQPLQMMEVKWDFYKILDLHLHPFQRPVGGATLVELKGSCFNTQVVQLQMNCAQYEDPEDVVALWLKSRY